MSVLSSAADRVPMRRVSLIVEALRAEPALMVWCAALAQGALWVLVPALFYGAPPGDVPIVLGIGREWLAGTLYGPPLGYWAAELAFDLAGGHIIGVYILSQLCVVVTYWAVFALGRRIVGAAHAAIAVLLMTGISAFTVPTVAFGPSVLAMPLSALAILFTHRAIVDDRRFDWIALGAAVGALVLTSDAGFILLAVIVVALVASPAGRLRLRTIHPAFAAGVALAVNLPRLYGLWSAGINPFASLRAIGHSSDISGAPSVVLWPFATHIGLILLVLVAGGLFAPRRAEVTTVTRAAVNRFGKSFVYLFALAPLAIAMLVAIASGRTTLPGGTPALVILSGLALVVAAGDTIHLYRQRISALVWLGLLIGPPAAAVMAALMTPWLATDLDTNRPAAEMAAFFTDTFHRRTGKPLAIVIGDPRTAGLVALASANRPHLYVDGSLARAPWITDDAVRHSGAIVVWPVTDAAGTVPEALKARFPDLVAELPRAFERPVQGRLPPLRIGWSVIRPK